MSKEDERYLSHGTHVRVHDHSKDVDGSEGSVRERTGDVYLVLLKDGYYVHCKAEELEVVDG